MLREKVWRQLLKSGLESHRVMLVFPLSFYALFRENTDTHLQIFTHCQSFLNHKISHTSQYVATLFSVFFSNVIIILNHKSFSMFI